MVRFAHVPEGFNGATKRRAVKPFIGLHRLDPIPHTTARHAKEYYKKRRATPTESLALSCCDGVDPLYYAFCAHSQKRKLSLNTVTSAKSVQAEGVRLAERVRNARNAVKRDSHQENVQKPD